MDNLERGLGSWHCSSISSLTQEFGRSLFLKHNLVGSLLSRNASENIDTLTAESRFMGYLFPSDDNNFCASFSVQYDKNLNFLTSTPLQIHSVQRRKWRLNNPKLSQEGLFHQRMSLKRMTLLTALPMRRRRNLQSGPIR